MTTTYTIRLVVQGDDKASVPLGNVTNSLGGMQTVMGGILGADMLRRFTTGVFDMGRTALDSYIGYERLGLSLQSLVARELMNTGAATDMASALGLASDKSQDLIAWVEDLAILTPFSQEDVSQATQLAMSFGFTSDQARRLTTDIIDYASATGKSGEVVDRMMLSLGQMRTAGKLTGMEIRELAMAGLPVKQILAEGLNVTTAELQEMIEDGVVPADAAFEILAKSIEEDFGGAAERQAETFAGLTTSLEDLTKISLREYFTETFTAIQPYLADFVTTLQDPETRTAIREMGVEFAGFVTGSIDGIKSVIVWWEDLGESGQDFMIFLGGVVVIGPQVIGVITKIVVAAQVLPGVLTAIQTGWAAWNAGMSLTTALGAAGLTPIALTVGAIALAVGSVAAVWYTWNVQITKTVEEGRKLVGEGWTKFFNEQVASGASAEQVLAAYNAEQLKVKQILEETNPVIRMFMGNTDELWQSEAGLAEAIGLTANSYAEYKDVLFEAGLQSMIMTESQWAEIQAQAAMSDQAQATTTEIAAQTAAFSELTPEMIMAQMESEKMAQAQEEAAQEAEKLRKEVANTTVAYNDLAMSLKDASAAEIAKASINDLSEALRIGLISPQMYNEAVKDISLSYGLATEKSFLLADGIRTLTGYFQSGVIPAGKLDEALAELNKQAAAGAVDFDKIVEKYGEVPEGLDTLTGGMNEGATLITDATKRAMDDSVALIDGVGWYDLGQDMTTGVAEGADANQTQITTVMTEARNASWSVFEDADWFGLGKVLGDAIAKGILAAKPTIISAAIEVANAAIAAGKGVVPQLDSYTPSLGGGGLATFTSNLSASGAPASSPVMPTLKQVVFNAPVNFEVKERMTMDDIIRELSEL